MSDKKYSVDEILDGLFEDSISMIWKNLGKNQKGSQMRALISDNFRNKMGYPFIPNAGALPSLLMGAPGHGKTTAFLLVAERIADFLDMKLVVNPDDDAHVDESHFIVRVLDLSGRITTTELTGVPSIVKDDETGERTTVFSPTKVVNQMRSAGAGLIVVDDFGNLAPSIQNPFQEFAIYNRFGGHFLEGVVPAFTANPVGSGNHVHPLSEAMRNRVGIIHVEEKIESFCDRTDRMATKLYGENGLRASISGFIRSNPDLLSHRSADKNNGNATPRSWTACALTLGHMFTNEEIKPWDKKKDAMVLMDDARRRVVSAIGDDVGSKYISFLTSVVNYSWASALEIADTGKMENNAKNFLENYKQGGIPTEERVFATQYAQSLSDISAFRVDKYYREGNMREVAKCVDRFFEGIVNIKGLVPGASHINGNIMEMAGRSFIQRLVVLDSPIMLESKSAYLKVLVKDDMFEILKNTALRLVAKGFNSAKTVIEGTSMGIARSTNGSENNSALKEMTKEVRSMS